jgi:hypothetical protein
MFRPGKGYIDFAKLSFQVRVKVNNEQILYSQSKGRGNSFIVHLFLTMQV